MKRAKQQLEALDARLTVRLPREMLRALKHRAVEADVSLQKLTLAALQSVLADPKRRLK
jgi:predicted DNA binding CopG/RHH family protein